MPFLALQQAIAQEAQQGLVQDGSQPDVTLQVAAQTPQTPQPQQALVHTGSDDLQDVVMTPKKDAKSRPSLLDMSEAERIRRRREINRNSQRRIRERRMKELEELRTEVGRLVGGKYK